MEATRGWKSDEERGPVGAWFVRAIGERSIEQVAQDMADRGHAHKPDYYRGIMAGSKKPGRTLLRALEGYLGSSPTPTATVPQDVATALLRHADAMEAQAKAFTLLAKSIDQAAVGVIGRVGDFGDVLAALLREARKERATDEAVTNGDSSHASR